VTVLIDEYDAPITKLIDKPEKANEVRELLSTFYKSFKVNSTYLGFIFITGVSRFTKTSVFSGLNNLLDLTFNHNYAAICGFTQDDVDKLIELDHDRAINMLVGSRRIRYGRNDLKNSIKHWYDGYSWDGKTRVYNPWAILNFFKAAKFQSYWYSSGSPSFLSKALKNKRIKEDLLEKNTVISEGEMEVDIIAKISPEALLFQAGYLTIKNTVKTPNIDDSPEYELGIPNKEVKVAFVPLLLSSPRPENYTVAAALATETRDSLLSQDKEKLQTSFGQFLAQFTYDEHIPLERYYHSLFRTAMAMAIIQTESHKHTSHGRLDVHLRGNKSDDYIIELKYITEKNARDQEPPTDPREEAKLRGKMDSKARKTLKQISKKYTQSHARGSGRLVKAAIVIARRTFVTARFEVVERKPL
jgi:hypothetical protein